MSTEGMSQQTPADAMARKTGYGADGRASFHLKDQPRPALPIVLKGGIIPSGKKSWMKGKTYRETEVGALEDARSSALMEGTVDLSAMTESAWEAFNAPMVTPAARAPRTKVQEAPFVPTPKGTLAKRTPPPYDIMRRVFDGIQGVS